MSQPQPPDDNVKATYGQRTTEWLQSDEMAIKIESSASADDTPEVLDAIPPPWWPWSPAAPTRGPSLHPTNPAKADQSHIKILIH
jgi:hypothetical protein